jgi:hypothetical protein
MHPTIDGGRTENPLSHCFAAVLRKNDLILELRKNRGCPGDIQRRRPAGGKLLNVFNSFDPTKICLAVES